jgi:hypothetical protein
MSDEYRKFDSDDKFTIFNARLAKDAEVFTGSDPSKPPLVRITFVSTSRLEKAKDLWVEAKLRDYDSNLGAHLKKNDIVSVEGKPVLEGYGENKTSFKLVNAQIHVTVDLLMKCKERGFTPGAKGATPAKAPPPVRKPAARPVIDLGDDE